MASAMLRELAIRNLAVLEEARVVFAPGLSTTISGNGYHLFQFVYEPSQASADLYIDGTLALNNYVGHNNYFAPNAGIAWLAIDSAQARFNFASFGTGTALSAVPEPLTAAGVILCCVRLLTGRRRFSF